MASKEEMKKNIEDQIKALQDELKKIDELFAPPKEEHDVDRKSPKSDR